MLPRFFASIAPFIAGVCSIAVPPFRVDFDDEPCTPEQIQNKPFDITIFGAMGFLGQHALYYILNHPDKPRWAITGRNLNRLKYYVSTNIGGAGSSIGTFEADLSNPTSLHNVTLNSRVVVNFAGPYESIGSENLIHSAIMNCAHYVDLSDETKWKRYMHDMYSSKATSRQVALVQSGGFDSTASDMLAMLAAQDLVNAGVPTPTHILVLWELANSGIDGTKQKMDRLAFMSHGFVNDPYILAPEVPYALRVDKTLDGHKNTTLGYNSLFKTLVQQYFPAYADCPVIRRSLHKKFPNNPIYVEEVCTNSLVQALSEFRTEMVGKNKAVVLPGEGPPVDMQQAGSFMAKAVAMYRPPNSAGGPIPVAQVVLEGLGDPYSTASPKIAVELALGLVVESMHRVGYLTPSQVLGEDVLEQRLSKVDAGNFIRVRHGQ